MRLSISNPARVCNLFGMARGKTEKGRKEGREGEMEEGRKEGRKNAFKVVKHMYLKFRK